MCASICERVAKRVVARSQILKKCRMLGGGLCEFHIEESVFIQDDSYRFSDLVGDIDGFAYDVDRELAVFSQLRCDRNLINVNVSSESNLFSLSYDCRVQVDDAGMERIRTDEWQIEEK